MKAIRYIAILILAAALAACGEKSEPYYTSPNRSRNPTLTLTLNLNLNPTR